MTSDDDVYKLVWSHSTNGSVTSKSLYDKNFSHLNSTCGLNIFGVDLYLSEDAFFYGKFSINALLLKITLELEAS